MQQITVVLLVVCIGVVASLNRKYNSKIVFNDSPYDPPNEIQKAKRARYLLHNVNWGILSTLSTHYNRTGLPFSNMVAVSDGPAGNSSGTPYFYLMDMDISMQDVKKNNEVSFTISEEETSYCKMNNYNPEYPLCARVTLCGKLVKVTDPTDKAFALNALFSKFPDMKTWPSSHSFYPARINIELVWMLDFFGPSTVVPVKQYYAADPLQ